MFGLEQHDLGVFAQLTKYISALRHSQVSSLGLRLPLRMGFSPAVIVDQFVFGDLGRLSEPLRLRLATGPSLFISLKLASRSINENGPNNWRASLSLHGNHEGAHIPKLSTRFLSSSRSVCSGCTSFQTKRFVLTQLETIFCLD